MASIQQWNSFDFLDESHCFASSDNIMNSLIEQDLMNTSYSTAEDAQSLPDSFFNRRYLQSFGSAFSDPPISSGSMPVTPTTLQPSLSGSSLNDPLQLAHLFKGSLSLESPQRSSLSLDTPNSPTLTRNSFTFVQPFSHSQESFSSSVGSGSNSPLSDTPTPTLENFIELVNLVAAGNQQIAALKNAESRNALNALIQLQQQNGLNPLSNLNLLYGNQLKNLQIPHAPTQTISNDPLLDYIAKSHRQSFTMAESSCTWNGVLPTRQHTTVTYSTKVFLGGVPWDMSEESLMAIFRPLGTLRIEWPGKDNRSSRPRGCAYLIFNEEDQVRKLLDICDVRMDDGEHKYFFRLLPKGKEAEVIPWIEADSTYIKPTMQNFDPMTTVFVGALHGKLTAEGLATIMDGLFGGVIYAAIDVDKNKYPMGAGRVTFDNTNSYVKAVRAAFVEIKTPKFKKKIQVDPYLEDHLCSSCSIQHGPYFCREITCFKYYCRTCWLSRHSMDPLYRHHNPMSRNSKSQTLVGIGPMAASPNIYPGLHR